MVENKVWRICSTAQIFTTSPPPFHGIWLTLLKKSLFTTGQHFWKLITVMYQYAKLHFRKTLKSLIFTRTVWRQLIDSLLYTFIQLFVRVREESVKTSGNSDHALSYVHCCSWSAHERVHTHVQSLSQRKLRQDCQCPYHITCIMTSDCNVQNILWERSEH